MYQRRTALREKMQPSLHDKSIARAHLHTFKSHLSAVVLAGLPLLAHPLDRHPVIWVQASQSKVGRTQQWPNVRPRLALPLLEQVNEGHEGVAIEPSQVQLVGATVARRDHHLNTNTDTELRISFHW